MQWKNEAKCRGRNELQQNLGRADAMVEKWKENFYEETQEHVAEFQSHKADFRLCILPKTD